MYPRRGFANSGLLTLSIGLTCFLTNHAPAKPGDLYQIHGPSAQGTRAGCSSSPAHLARTRQRQAWRHSERRFLG